MSLTVPSFFWFLQYYLTAVCKIYSDYCLFICCAADASASCLGTISSLPVYNWH